MKFLILVLLVLASCSSKDHQSSAPAVNPETYLDSFWEQCRKGDEKACSKHIKLFSALRSPVEAMSLTTRECNQGKMLYCYLDGYLEFYSGNVDGGIKTQQELCKKNDKYACHFLGYQQYEKSRFTGKAPESSLLTKACKAGDLKSCTTEAIYKLYYSKKLSEFEKIEKTNLLKTNVPYEDVYYLILQLHGYDSKKAESYADQFCKDGSQDFCYLQSQFKKTDEAPKYCALGVFEACGRVCDSQVNAGDVSAINSCEKNCYSGNAESCHLLGTSELLKNDKDKTEQLFKIGCAFSGLSSCLRLGHFYEVNNQSDLSWKPYTVACESGVAWGCNRLAGLSGQGNQPDTSLRAAQTSCFYNDGVGCFALGVKFHQDKDKQDRKFFEKSCKANNRNGCMAMCALTAADKNVNKSKEYLIKACVDSNHVNCFPFQNKTVKEIELKADQLLKQCTFDTKMPWWYWASSAGAGMFTGQTIN